MIVRDDPPPSSSDLEAWREAVSKDRLRAYKVEVLVAALQDLGPNADERVREALASRISKASLGMLRNRVGVNHSNRGWDIIERVHADILAALFDPASADGRALRTAFSARVSFRIKDAIAAEFRHSRIPVDQDAWKASEADPTEKVAAEYASSETEQAERPAEADAGGNQEVHEVNGTSESIRDDCRYGQVDDSDDDEFAFQTGTIREADLFDGVRELEEKMDNARTLSTITDERKRLAFYLYMDRIPIHAKEGPSIAKALGVDRKTVGIWIAEVQKQLSQNKEVILLESASSGGRQ